MTTPEPVDRPFDELATPIEAQPPRPSFARSLRARLTERLGLDDEPPPAIPMPERKPIMTTSSPTVTTATALPYLTVHDGAAAIDWYADALGAVEQFRVVGDDGLLGHAEIGVGGARIMLSDAYPDLGVLSPRDVGGTTVALHLTVADVDATFARAVAAGATALADPQDQAHGARHGTIVDPFGHRWMLSQDIEQLSIDEYAERAAGSGFEVRAPDTGADGPGADIPGTTDDETIVAADRPGTGGGIWAGAYYDDALAGIRFLIDTFGFEEQIVVVGDDGTTVVHSQLRWPEGGVVQAGTYDAGNEFTHAPGEQSLYVVTADPQSVWARCEAAGVDVVRPPSSPDYDPEGMGFSVRDPEGNIWSFGSYGLDAGV